MRARAFRGQPFAAGDNVTSVSFLAGAKRFITEHGKEKTESGDVVSGIHSNVPAMRSLIIRLPPLFHAGPSRRPAANLRPLLRRALYYA
jgi:hypothetical protein